MKLTWILLLSILGNFACGGDETSPSNILKPVVNAIDPASEKEAGIPSTSDKGEAMCLGDCKTSPIANIAFAAPLSLMPASCTVKDMQAFALSESYVLITFANCLEGIQVYHSRVSLTGGILSAPRPVSFSCYANFQQVMSFAAASDGNSLLLAYSCRMRVGTSIPLKIYLANVQIISGDKIEEREISSETSFYSSELNLQLAYNILAKAYGLLYKNQLYRFDSSMKQLGGSVNTYLSSSNTLLQYAQGNWFAIVGGYSNTTCSKVNSSGILGCDRKI